MEGWQRAFVLCSHPWNETSLVLDIFMEEPSRVHLVAKSARSKRSNLKDVLQPFTLLLFHFSGRGKVKTLHSAGAVSLVPFPNGITLYGGLYISKLTSRVLEYKTRLPALFFDYLNCTQALTGATGSLEPALRRFELALLGHLGHGIGFTHRAGSGEPVDDTMTYRYRGEKGFIAGAVVDNATLAGRHLKALGSREFPDTDTSRAAKRFTRMTLKPYLDGKPLKSRGLFRQFMPKRE